MTTLARLLALPSMIAVAAVAVACGGASPEEFRQQANEICVEAERASEGLGQPASSPEQAGQVLDRAEETLQGARERFEGVDVPSGEEGERAERYVELFGQQTEQASGALDGLRGAIESEDPQQLQQAVQELQRLEENKEIADLAKQLRLDQCQ